MRTALAELPALPIHQRPKPATAKTLPADVPKIKASEPLTPPSTPPKPGNIRASISTEGIEARLSNSFTLETDHSLISGLWGKSEEVKFQETEVKVYDKRYILHEELGHGVWSNVYHAEEILQSTASRVFPLSPPNSPINGRVSSTNKILAVKRPHRRDAHRILENEAKVLTFLHADTNAPKYLVHFYGFDVPRYSIVLGAVTLTLETHAKAARRRSLSTKTMFDPVVGAEEWADMSEGLISGLNFLHNKGCIHGDIKPANILLRPDESDRLEPLYCDFSSSRITPDCVSDEIEEVSAVTADYTSPELLESLSKRNSDRAVTTFASDVFALAVTLLFAAIGESPYTCARMDLQKLGMAKEGVPLRYTRLGEQASRIMEGRAVEGALQGALTKDPVKRLGVGQWRTEMKVIIESWRAGGWSRGG